MAICMKIAVTYENGSVFQHFGKTKQFKIYETDGGEIINSSILDAGDSGHEALALLLGDNGVDVIICGGIGAGAQNALAAAGVELISGAEGDADKAVEDFLCGNLSNAGVNCSHHGSGGCGGDCHSGGCGGGCHTVSGKNSGKKVRTHYTGTFNDGSKFASSYDRGEPLEFICGAGMMIRGFDKAVANMEVGEKVKIHLMPEEAYGTPDPNAIFTIDIANLPGSEELNAGEQVYLQNEMGQPFAVTVKAKDEKTITFDANHEMAGKELNFEIELVSVE